MYANIFDTDVRVLKRAPRLSIKSRLAVVNSINRTICQNLHGSMGRSAPKPVKSCFVWLSEWLVKSVAEFLGLLKLLD